MLLTLIIILILIWAAVIWSIYSNFLVFHSNFSESENYHKAYYASISALERWELVTKQRSPWYVWSGWFIMWKWEWGNPINNDWWADKSLSGFSYLWYNDDVSSVFWTINSRTTRIPSISWWDVERMLSTGDAPNYNMMWYENSEVFLLYYDNSEGNPYVAWSIDQSKPEAISWIIRLPKLLYDTWSPNILDTQNSSVWGEWQLAKDDAIVDWQIRWKYGNEPFTIYSTQKENFNKTVNLLFDSIFRESDINNTLKFSFDYNNDPINDQRLHWDHAKITVISNYANIISWFTFKNIFTNNLSNKVSLRFSLVNLLRTSITGHIYPFLEYYADFWGNRVSDKYYTIDAEWNFKDYQVNTIIQKPTIKESVLSNFTSIF